MLGGLTPRVNFSAKPIQNWWETHIFQCKTLTKLVKPIQNWWETQIFQCKTLTKLVNNTNFLVENRPPLSSQASKSMILVIESSHRNPPPDSSQTHVDIQIWDPNSSSVQLCEGQERFRIAQQLHTARIWTPVQTKAPMPHSYQCSGSWQNLAEATAPRRQAKFRRRWCWKPSRCIIIDSPVSTTWDLQTHHPSTQPSSTVWL